MHGKLIDSDLIIAPKKLIINDTQVWNASASEYLVQGWKEIILTEQPSDPPEGYQYVNGWEDETETIVQTWTLVPLEDIDDAEALNIILGGEE